MLTEFKTPTRKRYLCREDYLSEGVRLLRQVIALDNKASRDAYAAWEERAKPTQQEKLTVMRLARTPRRRVIEG